MNTSTFSFEKILNLLAEGFAAQRYHAAMMLSITTAIDDLDKLSRTHAAVPGSEPHLELVKAAKRLESLLVGVAP